MDEKLKTENYVDTDSSYPHEAEMQCPYCKAPHLNQEQLTAHIREKHYIQSLISPK